MYTNAIIGSYNTIANSEHGAMIMKPPIRRQPKKSNSKESHTPKTTRGNSAEEQIIHGSGGNTSVNSVLSPTSSIITCPTQQGPSLPGLEILVGINSVLVQPDKVFSPEVSKISFTIDEEAILPIPPPALGTSGHSSEEKASSHRPLLLCVPTDGTNSRSLSLQTLDGKTILQLHTTTPYCCSWYQNLESRISLPNGDFFANILKTAFGPCKCNRKFLMTCRKDSTVTDGRTTNDKVQFDVEVLMTPSELLIKDNSQIVAKVTTRTVANCQTAYKVTFESELSPCLKALFIAFAINLHIAFAEKLNTCFGMGLCCFAGSSVAAWIMCFV